MVIQPQRLYFSNTILRRRLREEEVHHAIVLAQLISAQLEPRRWARRWWAKPWIARRRLFCLYYTLFQKLERESEGDYICNIRMSRNMHGILKWYDFHETHNWRNSRKTAAWLSIDWYDCLTIANFHVTAFDYGRTMLVRQPSGRRKTNAKYNDLRTSWNRVVRLSQDCLETSKICQKSAEIMCVSRCWFATLWQPCDLKNSYDCLAPAAQDTAIVFKMRSYSWCDRGLITRMHTRFHIEYTCISQVTYRDMFLITCMSLSDFDTQILVKRFGDCYVIRST
jgi:hypothetical protein